MEEQLVSGMEQLSHQMLAVMGQVERAIAAMEERHAHVCGDVQKIVATAEGALSDAGRAELERKLAEAEQKIAVLEARTQKGTETVRKTVAAGAVPMLGKGDLSTGEQTGVLDAALGGLSLEQRIAVKSQLLRSGLI